MAARKRRGAGSGDTARPSPPPPIGHNGGPGPTLNPALREFWLTPARNRVLYGGRSSSKSWDAAGFAIFLASNFKVRFLCTRQFQNKIEESVYTLLKIQIHRFGLQAEFTILNNKIVHNVTGSEFIFYGLWRHIDEIKSLEGVDICWIEEAHNLTKEQWDILEPTIRKEGSQFWIIFNPRLANDFVYRKFVLDVANDNVVGQVKGVAGRTIKRKINYTENPFLSQTIREVIEAKQEEDAEEFAHIYLGEPREDDDAVIIKRSWVLAAIDARRVLIESGRYTEEQFGGRRRIGFDVADSGEDKCATVETYGIEAQRLDEWKAREDELLKSATRVHSQARERGAEIVYDCIGVGAFAGSHFEALNAEHNAGIQHTKFNAGAGVQDPDDRVDPQNPNSPTNQDFYCNLKAQTWWDVAARFRNTFNAVRNGMNFPAEELISISSECDHLDDLIDELCAPRRDFDNAGKVKVESKKDLAKREIKSPNKADAFVMAYARGEYDISVWAKLAG
jgi:phage terminase large subunit